MPRAPTRLSQTIYDPTGVTIEGSVVFWVNVIFGRHTPKYLTVVPDSVPEVRFPTRLPGHKSLSSQTWTMVNLDTLALCLNTVERLRVKGEIVSLCPYRHRVTPLLYYMSLTETYQL